MITKQVFKDFAFTRLKRLFFLVDHKVAGK